MKLLCAFAFVALFALVSAQNTLFHHLNLGKTTTGERLLHRERITADASWFLTKSEDYTFDQKNVENPATITSINVYDGIGVWKGGYASLTSGGPGFDHATIHCETQWRGAMDFTISIYGI